MLLIDEPLANLDADASAVVSSWFKAMGSERVVIIASHEPLPFSFQAELDLDATIPREVLADPARRT